MSTYVAVCMFEVMCVPIKVGICVYATYSNSWTQFVCCDSYINFPIPDFNECLIFIRSSDSLFLILKKSH